MHCKLETCKPGTCCGLHNALPPADQGLLSGASRQPSPKSCIHERCFLLTACSEDGTRLVAWPEQYYAEAAHAGCNAWAVRIVVQHGSPCSPPSQSAETEAPCESCLKSKSLRGGLCSMHLTFPLRAGQGPAGPVPGLPVQHGQRLRGHRALPVPEASAGAAGGWWDP